MFDIGWGEMLVIAIVVIVVVGPKELPGMLRTFGRTTSKLRVMANDFRRQFDEALKEAELDDVRKIADDVRSLNPTNELKKALSPMEKAAQDVRAGLDAAMKPAANPAAEATSATAQPATAAVASPQPTASAKPVSTKPAAAKKAVAAKPKPVAAKPAAAAKPTAAAKPAVAKAPAAKASTAKPRAAKAKTGGDVS